MKTQKYPNLKPWQPGQSGNPAGRKPGSKNISTIVQELLDEDTANGILASSNLAQLTNDVTTTYAKAVVYAAIAKALQGNMQAIIWLAEQQERNSSAQQRGLVKPIVISNIKPRQFAVD
jgi:chorismate mutase